MTQLITTQNFQDADGFYAALLNIHTDKSAEQSAAINAKLILLLANHIGDKSVLLDALDKAA